MKLTKNQILALILVPGLLGGGASTAGAMPAVGEAGGSCVCPSDSTSVDNGEPGLEIAYGGGRGVVAKTIEEIISSLLQKTARINPGDFGFPGNDQILKDLKRWRTGDIVDHLDALIRNLRNCDPVEAELFETVLPKLISQLQRYRDSVAAQREDLLKHIRDQLGKDFGDPQGLINEAGKISNPRLKDKLENWAKQLEEYQKLLIDLDEAWWDIVIQTFDGVRCSVQGRFGPGRAL